MEKNNLVIINNEKIFKENNNYFCDNLDLKVLPEGLSQYHEVNYIVRTSKKKGGQKLNLKSICAASNIFKFIFFILKTLKKKKYKIFININNSLYFCSLFSTFFYEKKNNCIFNEQWS